VAEKFANPLGRKTDAALFSGKRMDDDEQVEYRAAGAPSILMMCSSLAAPRRVITTNTIRC
jgi:S-DNA-T family DNA segregation ATPase FtsK/SpoIIIE